jgi:quercetin dioxygenase-like cupin family protein
MAGKPKKSKLVTRKSAVKRLRASQPAAKRPRTKFEARHISWDSVELEDLNPLLRRHFVVGQSLMLARVLLKKGCVVPEHSHHNEQLTYVLEGALKFWIGGKIIVVNAGEVLSIPPNLPHKAEALEDTVDIDVFNPPREDWMNKTDQYLRGSK